MAPNPAILVIGPSWIGDAVMAQCLLEALKRRSAEAAIDVLAPAGLQPLLARMPQVRSALAAPFGHGELALRRRLALGANLRGCYDEAYVLPGSWKSALVPWAARVPRRIGYRREWRHGLINDMRSLPEEKRRATASAFQALADPAVTSDASRLIVPHLAIDGANREYLLARWRLRPGQFAALAPGAEYGPAKRWPARHWEALCAHLRQRALTPVLLGGTGDREVTAAIAAKVPGAVDLAGRTALADAIDLLSACHVAVTNDSGLMHVAAAVGAAVVAIYGSTSPANTPPLSPRARVVTLGLACSPCHARRCPLGHLDCLETLAPERVIAHLP